MLVDQMGEAVLEHVDHLNCLTRVEMGYLWECLANTPVSYQEMVTYGPTKYCVHKDHVGFGVRTERCVKGTLI